MLGNWLSENLEYTWAKKLLLWLMRYDYEEHDHELYSVTYTVHGHMFFGDQPIFTCSPGHH